MEHYRKRSPEADPPYGVGADKFRNQSAVEHAYDDSAETADRIIDFIIRECYRASKPQAHLYMFHDVRRFGTIEALVNKFNEELKTCEDWEMWLVLSKFYKPKYISEIAYNRWDSTSVMRGDISNKNKWMALKRRIKRKLIKLKFRIR